MQPSSAALSCILFSFQIFPFICCSTPRGVVHSGWMMGGRSERSNELFISYSCLVQDSVSHSVVVSLSAVRYLNLLRSSVARGGFIWQPNHIPPLIPGVLREDVRQRTPIKQQCRNDWWQALHSLLLVHSFFIVLARGAEGTDDGIWRAGGGRKAHLLSFAIIKIQSSCSRSLPTAGKYVAR